MAVLEDSELQARKSIRLRLRPNLVFILDEESDKPAYVLKDPASLRYFRLEEKQKFVLELMDGRRTLEEIQKEFERNHRPIRFSLEELEAFAAQLVHSGLVYNDAPLAGQVLYQQCEKQRLAALRARLLNVLCIRVPLLDPDRLLARLVAPLGFLFSFPFLLVSLLGFAATAGLIVANWNDFWHRLTAYSNFFTPQTIVYLWLAFGIVKILHELGHGLCCKTLRGEVREMGLLLLFFFPALYCNVTDAWKLPRRHRIAVSAAGMYVELLIACVAAFLWWATHPGSLLHHLSFSLMLVCSINTIIFNANPLMRFDGYFIFSDWLGIPNLAELSGKVVRNQCLRCLGIPAPDERNLLPRRRRLLLTYGLLSFAYRWIVLAGSLYVLWLFLSRFKLGALAVLLAAGVLLLYLVGPVFSILRAILRQGTYRRMKFARLALTLIVISALTAVVTLVPFPRHIEAMALVQADPLYLSRVTIPDPGAYLHSLAVRDGQTVQEGEILAVLANPKLDVALQLNEADQALRAQQQRDLIAFLAEAVTADLHAADWQLTEYELQSLGRQHDVLKLQQDLLVLRAPRAGTILGLPSQDMVGKWQDKGSELCRIGNEQSLRAVLLVESADQPHLRAGNPARLLVHGCGGLVFSGAVQDVAVVDAKNIPPQLSSQTGGDVPTERDPLSGQVRPQQQRYLSTVHLTLASPVLHPGAMGRVQIEVDSQTLWWRFQRLLARSFRWE